MKQKYRITDSPYKQKQISGPVSGHQYLQLQRRRTTIILSRFTLILALIGSMIMMGYAGAEIGFLVGGAILVGVSYAIFEVMLRAGHSILTSALAGALNLTFLFASGLSENIIGTSIRVGASLQKISHAGLVILAIYMIAQVFRRKE